MLGQPSKYFKFKYLIQEALNLIIFDVILLSNDYTRQKSLIRSEIKLEKCECSKVYYNLLYFFAENFSNNNIGKHRRARLLCPILIGLSLVPRSFYRKKPIDQSLPPTPEKTAKNLITLTFNHISHFFPLISAKN